VDDAFSNYRRLEKELRAVRLKNANVESQEEDAILETMDSVWRQLSEEEREVVRRSEAQHLTKKETKETKL
jgi:hypothetical protein